MPQMVHGGPGRAGGGEELGGVRSLQHYMQRTALQGSPAMLSGVTGRWFKGSPVLEGDLHPFRYHYDDLEIGRTLVSKARQITLDDIEHFAHFTGDTFYAHMDEEATKGHPFFPGRVAAWLSAAVVRGRPVRRSGLRTGAGELRHSTRCASSSRSNRANRSRCG